MRSDEVAATTSAELRAHNLTRLLRAVHDGGGRRTRAELTRLLGLARGTATVLVRELGAQELITELPADVLPERAERAQRARGRPTGVPSAHKKGPVALAVEMRDDSFTTAAFELTGRCQVLDRWERDTAAGTEALKQLAIALTRHRRKFSGRVIGIGVAAPSPVSGGKMVQPMLADWRGVDIAEELGPDGRAAKDMGPVLVGNDATLAGLAEARRGVLSGVPVALHLHVATGIGGVLLTGGKPSVGAHGAAGEFGHMPLTGGHEPCRCGAVGCWELDVGAPGLLRQAGQPERGDRVEAAAQVIAVAGTDPASARAVARVARSLGRGIGALVNAHDPEAVGLSGLAASLFGAAPDAVREGYLSALMRFRRHRPPELLPSTLGDLGALTGAAELVFDAFLTPRGLAVWRQ
ncbi:MAG TPA: ROK family protein [Streptosporangiaceae bacterium]